MRTRSIRRHCVRNITVSDRAGGPGMWHAPKQDVAGPDVATAGGEPMADKQRIGYVPLDRMDDEMRAEMERCAREGTPRPESSAVRAHVPACFWFFARSWHDIFRNGVCDHQIKELCRVYVSRTVQCEYCGNQRSVAAAAT